MAFTEIRLVCGAQYLERLDVRSFEPKDRTKFNDWMDILHSCDLIELFNECDYILSHNVLFDLNVLCNEMSRLKMWSRSSIGRDLDCLFENCSRSE